ncbi:hypothetical protein [Rhizobium phage RHEph12]|nr:hypothetical protein [Rhizobium phage RHEph12]
MRKLSALRSGVAHISERKFNGSNDRVIGQDGNINAGSRQELMVRLAEIATMINDNQVDVSAEEDTRSSRAILEEAYADPVAWAELGSGLAGEVQERLLRDGFMRQILQRGEVEEGNTPRIRVRTPNVTAIVSRGIATHWPKYVGDKLIQVDEYVVNATPEVDIVEMHQSSGDILEDKYYEALEGIFAAEDRLLVNMLRQTVGIYNAPTYYTGSFTHVILQTIRQGVTDWLLPAQTLLIGNTILSDMLVGNEFSTWFDPISKWEIVRTGNIGSILGMSIITDGYREPVFKVLQPTEAFVLSSPQQNGVYTDRGPVISTPIDGQAKGTNTKGWNLMEIISVTFANAKACAYAVAQ